MRHHNGYIKTAPSGHCYRPLWTPHWPRDRRRPGLERHVHEPIPVGSIQPVLADRRAPAVHAAPRATGRAHRPLRGRVRREPGSRRDGGLRHVPRSRSPRSLRLDPRLPRHGLAGGSPRRLLRRPRLAGAPRRGERDHARQRQRVPAPCRPGGLGPGARGPAARAEGRNGDPEGAGRRDRLPLHRRGRIGLRRFLRRDDQARGGGGRRDCGRLLRQRDGPEHVSAAARPPERARLRVARHVRGPVRP